jgi:hypothetical protein
MDNQAAQRVKQLIAENEKIGILVGKNPTLDQMAGTLSLYLGLKQLGKNPAVASASQPIVANSSLVGIDKVKNELASEGGDLIVSFPYQEGEIEKVSYTLENGYLNIVVKATEEGLSFQQEDVLFKRSGGVPTLLFIVGTPRLSDLGSLFDAEGFKNTTVVNIDNQNENQGFGDVVLVTPQASSVSELVASLLQSLEIDMDQDISQNLMSGIAQATNNFQNPTTTYMAFAMVAEFMKKGAKRPAIDARPAENPKSPFGPFTMPQPRQNNQPRQQQQNQPRQQRPWEQRPQQQNQPRQQMQQQRVSPMPQPAPVATSQPVAAPQPMMMPTPAPMAQNPQKAAHQVEHKEDKEDSETPPDWLAPKVYKSSTLI